MRPIVSLLALTALFVLHAPGTAQEAADEELEFVKQLRARGYADLALEYLETNLAKNPRYAPVLAIEVPKTRLALAVNEADGTKRGALFNQVRAEFEDFLKKNVNHPRANEVRLELAQVGVQQGKSQLARSLALPENDATRADEFLKARKLLADAAKELKVLADGLADKKAQSQALIERSIVLIAQARTYLTDKDEKVRSAIVNEAADSLERLSGDLDNKDPLRWVALAWCGRAHGMNDDPETAGKKFAEVRASAFVPPRGAARRLVDYFEMLADYRKIPDANPPPADVNNLLTKAIKWRTTYSDAHKTPEGLGVAYLMADMHFQRGAAAGDVGSRDTAWNTARAFARLLEETDNEFTAQATDLKIKILFLAKAFDRPIKTVDDLRTFTTFDDLFMRAIYEDQQLNKDSLKKEEERKFATKEKQEEQQKLVAMILGKAVEVARKANFKNIPEVDLGNAYYLLVGYNLNLKNPRGAVDAGVEFVNRFPRARQAATIALHSADALDQLVREAGDDSEKGKADREALLKLANLMADRFPGEKAGMVGRYQIAMHLIRQPIEGETEIEKKANQEKRDKEILTKTGDFGRFLLSQNRVRENRFEEAVQLLRPIKPDFPNYTMAQYQLALACKRADDDSRQPPAGDPRPFKVVALEALERIPEVGADTDPQTNFYWLQAKLLQSQLLYGMKRYDEMAQLSKKLAGKLEDLRLEKANEADRKTFETQVQTMYLYAMYGKSDTLEKAKKPAEAAALLDPLVNELEAGKYPEVKENPQLLTAVLEMCLRCNLQAARLERAQQVVAAWEKIEGKPDTLTNILRLTMGVLGTELAELKKANDKARLNQVIDSYSAFFDALGKDEAKQKANLRWLAQAYSLVGKYDKAAKLLETVPEPAKPADPKDPAQKAAFDRAMSQYRVVRVLAIRNLHLQGKENNDENYLKKAEAMVDEAIGTNEKPGWGRTDINALKEQITIYLDLKYYGAAVNRASSLTDILQKKLDAPGDYKTHYYEVYYYYVYGMYQYGVTQQVPAKRDEFIRKAAQELAQLLKNHPTMDKASKARFDQFLESAEGKGLKSAMDALKTS